MCATCLETPRSKIANPTIGRDAQDEWLSAPADAVADIQARPIANDALEILDEEEASAYAGAYIK